MQKEILMVIEMVANERGLDKAIMLEALEHALAGAIRKKQGEDIAVRVSIDPSSGESQAFRRWQVMTVESLAEERREAAENAALASLEEPEPEKDDHELDAPLRQIWLEEAQQRQPEIAAGEFLEESMEAPILGRIAAQTAKQIIISRLRAAERQQLIVQYEDQVGSLISGVVRRLQRHGVYLDLSGNAEGGSAEAFIPREDMIPREAVRVGDRLRAFLVSIDPEQRGPILRASRTDNRFLEELFRLEVPEVGQGIIELMGVARDPGVRAKILVRSNDPRLDPVGACVGMRGSRVQTIYNELAGERIDIILWDEDPAQLVINAMSPAAVVSVVIHEEEHKMDVAVSNEGLAQAIGRSGQNVRLASSLTGWTLNVMDEATALEKQEAEAQAYRQHFVQHLNVDENVAEVLVQEGFTSIKEVAYVPEKEFLDIAEFDEDIVQELRRRARDKLLTQAIVKEEGKDGGAPSEELLKMAGMTEDLAQALARQGIVTVGDLADESVDELVEKIGELDEEQAGSLILQAREPLFEQFASKLQE